MQPNLPTFRSDSAPVGLGFEHPDARPPPLSALGGRTERTPSAAGNLRRQVGPEGSVLTPRGAPRSHSQCPHQGPSRRNLFLSASFVDVVLLLGYSF